MPCQLRVEFPEAIYHVMSRGGRQKNIDIDDVFSGRYKAVIVEGSGRGYLRTAGDYVHLNPVRSKLLGPKARLLEYPWSIPGAASALLIPWNPRETT